MKFYESDKVTIHHGDCIQVLGQIPDASIDAVCTDPPYALSFMAKPWDSFSGVEDSGFAYWLAGLIDGEGHFAIKAHTRGTHAPMFALKMRADERGTLEMIRRKFGHGTLTVDDSGVNPQVRWAVQDQAGCMALVDMLDKYPLRAKKMVDYWTWREAVIEWVGRPKGNRWHGPVDNERMAHLRERLMTTRQFAEVAWSGNEFQDWVRLWGQECLRVLKPGGHLLAFGGTRTFHRLAAGLEDAGFEIRDNLAWIYASGFPKSRNVSEAMERFAATGPQDVDGPQREIRPGVYEVTRFLREARDRAGWSNKRIDELFGTNGMAGHWTSQATQPAVPSVRQWQELKVVLGFDDSMDELVAELASTERPEDWGSGAGDGGPFLAALANDPDATSDAEWGTALKPAFEPIVVGRKPVRGTIEGNVLTFGTGALHIGACRTGTEERETTRGAGVLLSENTSMAGGNYAREAGPVVQGRYPTNLLLDEHAADVLDQQSGERPAGGKVTGNQTAKTGDSGIYGSYGAIENRPYNDTGGASRFFYVAKPDRSERVRIGGVAHPTVKPLDLMRWLVRLVTPPGGTVLEPFAGSGTTVEACHLEGFRVVAIEQGEEYLPLIVQRLNRRQDPVAAVKATGDDAGLFDLLEEGA